MMLVNFSHEEIELPKATELGGAEKTSASLEAINDGETENTRHRQKPHGTVNTMGSDTSFKEYLRDKLGHLTQEERSVLEPVSLKYRHVFRDESNDFRETDLVEYKILTGDAKPIRRAHTKYLTHFERKWKIRYRTYCERE
jgi:hypothetical protein